MEERRLFSRVLFSVPATLTLNNDKWRTQMIDLSLKGALVACPEDWVDTPDLIQLSFSLCGDVIITMQVKQVDSRNGALHMLCDSIDIDSVSHLKRLVELNMGEESVLERELAQLSNA